MTININKKTLFVFDLDDTLYHEVDYLFSAFREISKLYSDDDVIFTKMTSWYQERKDVFDLLTKEFPIEYLTKEKLLSIYRNHQPDIQLQDGAAQLLNTLKKLEIPMLLITDGRSITQRNKIAALDIETYFDVIFISEEAGSEKKSGIVFQKINQKYSGYSIYTIGDNINKDFCWPQQLGWTTIGVRDKGKNIHSQEISTESCLPAYYIDSFTELYLHYE